MRRLVNIICHSTKDYLDRPMDYIDFEEFQENELWLPFPPPHKKPSQGLRLSWLVIPFTLARTKNATFNFNLIFLVMQTSLQIQKIVNLSLFLFKICKAGANISFKDRKKIWCNTVLQYKSLPGRRKNSNPVPSMFCIFKWSLFSWQYIFVLVSCMI